MTLFLFIYFSNILLLGIYILTVCTPGHKANQLYTKSYKLTTAVEFKAGIINRLGKCYKSQRGVDCCYEQNVRM